MNEARIIFIVIGCVCGEDWEGGKDKWLALMMYI